MSWVVFALLFWAGAWALNEWLVRKEGTGLFSRRALGLIVPLIFGATLLVLWEGFTRGFNIPTVLLPPPSMIWERIVNSVPLLWADFRQTFLKAVLAGYALGCGLGFGFRNFCSSNSRL